MTEASEHRPAPRDGGGRRAAVVELPDCALAYLQEGAEPDIVWIPGASGEPYRRSCHRGRSPFMPRTVPR